MLSIRKTLTLLLAEAIFYFKRSGLAKADLKFLVFTGTVGKTTTKDAVSYALAHSGNLVYSGSSGYTNELGMTLAALGVDTFSPRKLSSWRNLIKAKPADRSFICVEADADFNINSDWLIKHFSVFSVFICGLATQAWAAPLKPVRDARIRLLNSVSADGVLIFNSDDKAAVELVQGSASQASRADFTSMGEKAGVKLVSWSKNFYRPKAEAGDQISFETDGNQVKFDFSRQLFEPQVLAMSAALAFLSFLQIPLADPFKGFEFSKNRLQCHSTKNGALLIEDIYKATPSCTAWFLRMMSERPARKKILVLTEMRPISINADEHYRHASRLAEAADKIYFLGPKDIYAKYFNFSGRSKFITSLNGLAADILSNTGPDDVIFLKGSVHYHLETLRGALLP